MTIRDLLYEPFNGPNPPVAPIYSSSLFSIAPPSSRSSRPKLDLHEDAQKNLVTATLELPGIKKEDVQLTVHNNVLTVSAKNKSSSKSGYVIRERHPGKLSRSLQLPLGIKEEDVKAAMADGILTISFPKSSPEEEPKKITIA